MLSIITKSIYSWLGLNQKASVGFASLIDKNTAFEGNNKIGIMSSFKNSYIGKGSYIGKNCRLFHVKIGRFCSISDNVYIVTGAHPVSECISTYPAFYSACAPTKLSYVTENFFEESKYVEGEYAVKIGNDVWIGSNVLILQGIHIGDGAIVACGAVVTKDVAPYSVVGGVPAKVIKYRFSDEQIQLLKKLEWWNWDDSLLQKRAYLFSSPECFFTELKSEL